MGRKLNLTSLLFQTPTTLKTTSSSFSSPSSSSSSSSPSSNSSWQLWPSCKNPRTNSFNAENNNNIYKTVNSIYLEYSSEDDISLPANDVEDNDNNNDNDNSPEKALVKGLIRSDRFFFEPGSNTTSSLVVEAIEEEEEEEEEEVDGHGDGDEKMEESVVMMAMESEDPYADFRRSMEEVVGAHDEAMSRDWGWLEELLVWYLRVNGKANHGFIVGAFVDLLLELAGSKVDKASDDSSASSSSDYGYASCRSNSMSCTVSCEIEEEEEEEEGGGGCC